MRKPQPNINPFFSDKNMNRTKNLGISAFAGLLAVLGMISGCAGSHFQREFNDIGLEDSDWNYIFLMYPSTTGINASLSGGVKLGDLLNAM